MSKNNDQPFERKEEMLPLRTIKSIIMRDVEALVNSMYTSMLDKIEEQLNLQRNDITKIDTKLSGKITHISTDIIKIKEQIDLKIEYAKNKSQNSDKLLRNI